MTEMSLRNKELPVPLQRAQYRPSGGVNLTWFVPGAIGTIAAAAAMAWALWFMQEHVMHMVLVSTAIAACVPMLVLAGTVRWSKCRSPLFAWSVGLTAGALMHFGQYYAGMVHMAQQQEHA